MYSFAPFVIVTVAVVSSPASTAGYDSAQSPVGREPTLGGLEQTWSPEVSTVSIQLELNGPKRKNDTDSSSRYRIASDKSPPRTIKAEGHAGAVNSDQELSVICTQTAPFSGQDKQGTSNK